MDEQDLLEQQQRVRGRAALCHSTGFCPSVYFTGRPLVFQAAVLLEQERQQEMVQMQQVPGAPVTAVRSKSATFRSLGMKHENGP